MPTYNQLKESRRVHEGIFGAGVPFMETPKYTDEVSFDNVPKKYMLVIHFNDSTKWELPFDKASERTLWIHRFDLDNDVSVVRYDVI
ncbi:MAG: hypothetical protein IPJ51_06840 [Saprospiraceae bacterium]|nr:hypothetical protein [Saprospiraceae bacterium]